MTLSVMHRVFVAAKWLFAAIALATVYHMAYQRGLATGEQGVGYWQGWQDAMTVTEYGTKPYDSTASLLK